VSTAVTSSVDLPTRSEIEGWDTSGLTNAGAAWRKAATESEDAFDQHRQNISAPGGTTWEGTAKDAALARVTNDIGVVGSHGAVLREAATLAENGSYDIQAAQRKAVEAITEAEDDGFRVGEDLSVTDTRRADLTTLAARRQAADVHAEDIRWNAEQLVQADSLVGERLKTKAGELEGIRFEGEEDGHEHGDGQGHVQLVDNKVKLNPQDQAAGDGKDRPGAPSAGLPQVGPFPVPKEVADAAKKPDAKAPDPKNPDPTGLGDLLGADDPPSGKPGDGHPDKSGDPKPGLPPALSQLPPRPDQATIDRQVAKVDAARQTLAAAEAKANSGAVDAYTQGAGAGPSVDDRTALGQAVFDARRELTEQTKALQDLNGAVVANGGHPVPIPPLPGNADVQAFPPKPSAFAEGSRALSEGSLGIIPDVAKDLNTINNWDQASGADKLQAGLDAAGLLPIPGSKFLGEGLEHVLPGIAHHLDDVPVPHGHVDAPAGHATPDAPVDHSAPPPVEHHAPDPAPAPQHPADVFDPHQGLHYTSGDAHHPGIWPPQTPPSTWTPGSTNPGWHYIDRGPDKDWMPYQEQISGAERLPDGRIPEYARVDPDTGKTVNFDGHDIRGGHEVYLDAKDGYSALATDPGRPWTQGMEQSILNEIPRQLRALPPGASLEIHVSDPSGAAAIRNLVESNDWFDVTVIYTPKTP
jgi:hypothetical protein